MLLAICPTALVFDIPVEAASNTLLIDSSTVWKYLDTGVDPAGSGTRTSWTELSFDDSGWKTNTGKSAKFGSISGKLTAFSDGTTPTVLLNQYYTDGNNIPTYFFRTTFELSALPESGSSLYGTVLYDDAVIVYINGTKVAAYYEPSGGFASNLSYGGSGLGVPVTTTFAIDSSVLKTGENVVAVELHQANKTSSDVYFEMSRLSIGEGVQEAVALNVGSDETMRNLSWRYPSANGRVEYGVRNGDEFPTTFKTVDSVATIATAQNDTYVHRVTMTGLEPDTEYVYRVVNDDVVSDNYYFETDPTDSFNFFFVADPQLGTSGSLTNDTAGWQNTLTVANQMFPNTSMIVSGGDQVDYGPNNKQYLAFFSSPLISSYAFASTIGNHDSGIADYGGKSYHSLYFYDPNTTVDGKVYGETPAGGDYWHTYNNTLFIHLNDNNLSGAEHKAFIQAAFDANPDMTWNILVMHKSLFSGGGNYVKDPLVEAREIFVPIIQEFDIDVVLSGHDHVYSRSHMMVDGYTPNPTSESTVVNPEGILYLTGGTASGSKFYGLLSAADAPHVAYMEKNTISFTNIEITETSFKLTTYRVNDKSVMDTFEIVKDPHINNLAYGKDYTASGIYADNSGNIAYPDEDGKSLTDGVAAGSNDSFFSDAYAGFNIQSAEYKEDGYASVTVDLGDVYSVDKFVAHFATQAQGAGIMAPAKLDVYVSENGTDYALAGSVEPDDDTEAMSVAATVQLDYEVKARYIQYRFVAGDSNWLMLSEVEAYEAQPVNLAYQKTYTSNGIYADSAGDIPYPDEDGITLTDGLIAPVNGKYSSIEYTGFNKSTAYYKENKYVSVEIDLENSYYVNRFVGYVGTVYNTGGIKVPSIMEVYVSADGADWTLAGSAVPVEDETQSCVPATVELEKSVECRYVQFRFDSAVNWMMIAELEVYRGIPYAESTPEPEGIIGDVNGDEKVDSSDYLIVKRACFETYTLSEDEKRRADINGDDVVNSLDYVFVKRIAFGSYTV